MSSARTVSDATFGVDVLRSATPVLVWFSSERCRPCRDMAPALDEITKDLEGKIKVVKIDANRELIIKSDYEVRGLPTMIMFKNGRPVARRVGALMSKERIEEWVHASLASALATQTRATFPRASEFTLSNGMAVVVIPVRRVPIVTHMVWYKVGAADVPRGAAGMALFLEHLMFKSTDRTAVGEFPKTISRLGGQSNAFSGWDVTAYYERLSKDQLETAMKMEASRMARLRLTDEEVAVERRVVMEVRRSLDSNPLRQLSEQMNAALFHMHPYGTPVIGSANEMVKLSRKSAMSFFRRHYAPNNAVLVVAGDVTPDEVERLAEKTYGKIAANRAVHRRTRPQRSVHDIARRVTLKDAGVGAPILRRTYAVPSYVTARPGEAEALDLLASILVGGSASRLHRRLVAQARLASSVCGSYTGLAVDTGVISLSAVARSSDLRAIEDGIDAVLHEIRENGVTHTEFSRAKKSLIAKYIYDSENQERLANRYGLAVAVGRTIEDIESWPDAISSVGVEDIRRVAEEHLDIRRSVTGWLLPEDDIEAAVQESNLVELRQSSGQRRRPII